MSERITVLLVDDHVIVRQGVRTFLELQPDIVVIGEAETGADAVRLAIEYAPDVVVMDLKLPEMDSIEATRKMVEMSPRTQVIVLTSYHEDEHIFQPFGLARSHTCSKIFVRRRWPTPCAKRR